MLKAITLPPSYAKSVTSAENEMFLLLFYLTHGIFGPSIMSMYNHSLHEVFSYSSIFRYNSQLSASAPGGDNLYLPTYSLAKCNTSVYQLLY